MTNYFNCIKRNLRFAFAIILFSSFSSCSSIPTTLVSSTSPIPAGVRGTIEAYGSDCQFYFLGLIPVTSGPNSQNALDRAKRDADVDVLTDVTVDHGGAYYILFSNTCVRVRGKGVPRHILARPEPAEEIL
jgi:hypothetical protein